MASKTDKGGEVNFRGIRSILHVRQVNNINKELLTIIKLHAVAPSLPVETTESSLIRRVLKATLASRFSSYQDKPEDGVYSIIVAGRHIEFVLEAIPETQGACCGL